MNERIRELALQAGALLSPGYNVEYTVKHVDSDVLAKFAELIVQECADFADEHNDFSEGVTLGVGRALKKHFGVAE